MSEAQAFTLLGIVEAGKTPRIVIWDTEEISFGRGTENDVAIEDSDVSRRHMLFTRRLEGFQVQDMGTSNGTTVNGQRLSDVHTLSNKDVVQAGGVQITFLQTRKNPKTPGREVSYASELKAFSGSGQGANPDATTLGLAEGVSGPFRVGSVIEYPNKAPRDLDVELGEFGPTTTEEASGRLSLTLELEGLTPDLRRLLESSAGKTIELPALKIRIKN
jgi:pSer/pThr/pTyr-binding forkhead associated (FHA) protein